MKWHPAPIPANTFYDEISGVHHAPEIPFRARNQQGKTFGEIQSDVPAVLPSRVSEG